MRGLICRLAFVCVVALVALPVTAEDDIGLFELRSQVQIGQVTLGPGLYVFRACIVPDRSLIVVYNDNQSQVLATAFALRTAVPMDQMKAQGELVYDRAVRSFTHGSWQYQLFVPRMEARIAAFPTRVATEIALAR